jgi:dihydrofolate reductase
MTSRASGRPADKVVYSSTLDAPATPKTRIEPAFQADAVARMKRDADRDISIGGATLAALAIRAGLVDEQQLLTPIIVGGGTYFLPPDEGRAGPARRASVRQRRGLSQLPNPTVVAAVRRREIQVARRVEGVAG